MLRCSARLGLRGIPRESEEIVLARDLHLVRLTGARYHAAHLSSAGSVAQIRAARAEGLQVSAEVSPYHLLFTEAELAGYDPNYKLSPPLRAERDRDALRQGVADGAIQCVVSDHRPLSGLEKDGDFKGADPGAIGLELTVPAILRLIGEGILEPMHLPQLLFAGPARIARLAAQGLREGAPANLTAVNPTLRWTITPEALRSRSHNTPLLGLEVEGGVTLTVVDGKPIHQR